MTKYARKILELVEASRNHMTAEQIFDALRETYPTVVLATVYNNLNRLWEEGRIRKLSVQGSPDRFDRIARHDHLVCRGCGRLSDVTLEALTGCLQRKVGVPLRGSDLHLHHLVTECRSRHPPESV